MRVTKLIREYVEESVAKIYLTQNSPEYSAYIKAFEKMSEEVYQAQKKIAEAALEQFEAEYPSGFYNKYSVNSYRSFNLEKVGTIYFKNQDYIRENRDKREQAIKDILITLELGGNKADPDKMLAELLEK